MNRYIISLLSGFLFSVGLGVSGMMNPSKVLNFLDILGSWDASLAFVMAGALFVTFFGFSSILKRKKSILGIKFLLPTVTKITPSIIFGSIFFGIGWGISGLCPGPVMANILIGNNKILLFCFSMLIGMMVVEFTKRRLK